MAEAAMLIGDAVRLREGAAHGRRHSLASEVGRIGDVWDNHDGERCTVVYEARQSLLCDVPASDFEPAPAGPEVLH